MTHFYRRRTCFCWDRNAHGDGRCALATHWRSSDRSNFGKPLDGVLVLPADGATGRTVATVKTWLHRKPRTTQGVSGSMIIKYAGVVYQSVDDP
jgi:hypothetical protein